MKAQNESESLAHMGAMLERHTMLSGRDLDWTNSKTHALQAIYAHWKDANPDSHTPFRITDLGIGDMLCLRNWEDFPETRYVGVDGCPLVLEQAAERHPDLTFLDLSFYNLVKERTVFDTDLIVSLDTLYHIPSQEVHDKMVDVIFKDCNNKYALISWATNLGQAFNEGTGVGTAGFSWFPRPNPTPEGWTVLWAEKHPPHMPQHQSLAALVRD